MQSYYNINVFGILFNICCVCVCRSNKLKELIQLIKDAKVDQVESWLKTNIPSPQQVPFVNLISHQSQSQQKNTVHIDIHPNIRNYFQNCSHNTC